MNHILREIKLSNLTDTPMSMKASKLVEFWDNLWADMKVSANHKKGEIVCWKDDYDYYYFYQNNKSARLWCDYNEVWTFFRDELKLSHDKTQELIQQMVSEALNYKVNIPFLTQMPHYN